GEPKIPRRRPRAAARATTAAPEASGPHAAMAVLVSGFGRPGEARRFTEGFRIGRGEECQLRIKLEEVSRVHAEVAPSGGRWWLRDLASKNGTFLDGVRVEAAPLAERGRVRLGADGPELGLRLIPVDHPLPDATQTGGVKSVSYYVQRYLRPARDGDAGERTHAIRLALAHVVGRQRRRYLLVIGALAILLTGAGALSVVQHRKMSKQAALAGEIFYAMKAVELQLLQLEERVFGVTDQASRRELEASRARFAAMQQSYDRFLHDIGVYSDKTPEDLRAILRIARVFGECEVVMPEPLVGEVKRYIQKWRGEGRLEEALGRARSYQAAPVIVAEMLKYHLPPQFFYLALQESEFKLDACGPETRFGIAKGPWQFIPSTAIAYGLRTGPLYLLRQADPRDERHDLLKSTRAAAKYLRDIYGKEAQASGLLVIASYNWGQGNVRQLIQSLPENPKDRNFWRLLVEHRQNIPYQTYDYLLRIFSAAVVGENPRLFGFAYENPLAGAGAT
ncbi:MAG: FHA domain-containing protein, partial [Acidobacteriota bacterium]